LRILVVSSALAKLRRHLRRYCEASCPDRNVFAMHKTTEYYSWFLGRDILLLNGAFLREIAVGTAGQ
jgi:hypothetical protein